MTSSKMPWYAPVKIAIVLRPVTVRAMRIAPITASEPVLQNAARSAPVTSQNSSRGLAGEHVLRADLVAGVDLRVDRVAQEVGLPAEQAHAEARQHVDVFVAVEVPQAAAARALDHDLVGELLGERTEAVDDARIGHVRAMRRRVRLRSRGARGVARDEGIEARALLRRQLVGAVWMRAMAPNAFLTS